MTEKERKDAYYQKHKEALIRNARDRRAEKKCAHKYGLMPFAQAASFLHFTVPQFASLVRSSKAKGQAYELIAEDGKAYYSPDSLNRWYRNNTEIILASIERLAAKGDGYFTFSPDMMLFINWVQRSNKLELHTAKYAKEAATRALVSKVY